MSDRGTRRLGHVGYAALVAHLRDHPSATWELVRDGIIGKTAALRILPALHRLGMLRVSDWRILVPGGWYHAVYTLANGEPDAPPPARRPSGRHVNCDLAPASGARAPVEVLQFFHLYEALQAPLTRVEAAAEVGMCLGIAAKALHALVAHRLAHITSWEPSKAAMRQPVAHYAWGDKPNRKKPARNRTRVNRESRARRRARESALATLPHLPAANEPVFNQRA